MLHLIFSVPCLYALIRFVVPLPWPLSMRIAPGAAMLIASQYHLWCRLSSGSVFSPEFPRPLILLFNWAFGAIVLLAAFLIVIDLGSLIVAAARQRLAPPPMPLRYVAAGLAGILAAIGVVQATRLPSVRDLTVEIANLPPTFDGYQIVQLTDLHISRLFPQSWARAVVQRTNTLDADLIVVTGDFIDGSVAARTRNVAPLRDLAAHDGTWFIPGNHEYFFGYAAWMRHLAGLGMRPLVNSHTLLSRGTDRLVLAGVTDLSAPETGNAPPDLNTALAGAPAKVPVLLLGHQPKQAPWGGQAGCRASAVRSYAWRHDPRPRPHHRHGKRRLRLGALRRRRYDPLRQQRHRALAWVRIAPRRAIGDYSDHAPAKTRLSAAGVPTERFQHLLISLLLLH